MRNMARTMVEDPAGPSVNESVGAYFNDSVSILHQAIVPSLVVLIEHSRALIKLFQLREQTREIARGHGVVIDDLTPGQTLRDELFQEYDSRLHEALQFLLEAMKYENLIHRRESIRETPV